MQIDFASVIAAAALILPTASALVLAYSNNRKAKELEHLRSCKQTLSDLLVQRQAEHAAALEEAHMGFDMEYELQHQLNRQQVSALESKLWDLSQAPLAEVSDEDLPHVIKKELTGRVVTARQASLPNGLDAHRLATACGGAAFRVVDHCKRGHGAFTAYGPYSAPTVNSTADMDA